MKSKSKYMAEMTGQEALGYMLIEECITAVRLRQVVIFKRDLERLGIHIGADELQEAGWEIGWECLRCCGTGELSVPCACQRRSLPSLLNNPCCDGWNDVKCKECEAGIKWAKEY